MNVKKYFLILFLVFQQSFTTYAQDALATGLETLLKDKMFESSDVSVAVYDLTADTLLFEHRAHKLVRPASVMKVLTSVVALDRLGVEYKFDTELYGQESDSALNLYVKGGMDPLFDVDDLVRMAACVPSGSIVDTLFADCSMTDSLYWGPGWSWDDNPYGYQPYLSPLMLCGGTVEVVVKPTKKDSVPDIKITPRSSFYSVVNEAVCWNEELGKLSILRDWLDDSNVIRVRGNCTGEKKECLNIYRSADFFMAVLAEKLDSLGVKVRNIAFSATPDSCILLHRCSRPLESAVMRAMLESENICAEAMIYHLGKMVSNGSVSMGHGCKVVNRFVKSELGVDTDFAVADGSGLSLYNYITADLLLRALRYAHLNSRVGKPLYNSMPVAGVSGTLKNRMKGSAAYRKVRAKTGTVKAVCSLAGYATASNGHKYAFVLLNTGMQSSRRAREWQDKVCELLCK